MTVIRNIHRAGRTLTFDLEGDTSMANAIRRALMEDVTTWAPHSVHIRRNTSCQTDEYLAHRIGLICFERAEGVDEQTCISLRAKGKDASTADCTSTAFRCRDDILIMPLNPDQEIDLDIHMKQGTGKDHVRWNHVAAAGFREDEDGIHFRFDSISHVAPEQLLYMALNALGEETRRVRKLLHCP